MRGDEPGRPRKIRAVIFVLLWCLSLIWVTANAAFVPPPGDSLAPMLEKVLPAVVNVSTRSTVLVRRNSLFDDPFFRRFFDLPDPRPRERQTQSLGSGVIIDAEKGHVLTNHHVVEDADEITVTLRDGRTLSATLVGADPETDVALLQVAAEGLTAIPVADSDKLRVGDFVVAIGNPFGLGQTVTYGIVSALGRTGLGIEGYEDFIQTDASINPGNSGGALVSTRGELVGINTAIVGPSGGNIGIGFAIPTNMARSVVSQLVKHGKVHRGELGVSMQDLTPELAAAFDLQRTGGAVVSRVVPGSPGETAGLVNGDIIVTLNGTPVSDSASLRNAIGLLPADTTVTLGVIRDGRSIELEITLVETAATQLDASLLSDQLAGAVIGDLRSGHALAVRAHGAEVLDVEPGSPAWQAGLRAGDIIASINREPIGSVEDVERAAGRQTNGLLLNILRGERALFIVIR